MNPAALEADPVALRATPVVQLRPLRPEDSDVFLRWAADPEVRRHYLGGEVLAATDTAADWVPRCGSAVSPLGRSAGRRERPAGHMVRAVETPDGQLLGWVELRDLNWRRRSGELRICLGDPATWGRGYGGAALAGFLDLAFGVWGLGSVHLRVAVWNDRAVRAYERCGFRREARLRAGRRAADGVQDLWLMRAVRG